MESESPGASGPEPAGSRPECAAGNAHSELESPGSNSPRHVLRWLAGLLLVLVSGWAWLPSIPGTGYTFDDREGVLANPAVNGAHAPLTAFTRDYWAHHDGAGHYRPLAQLSLALDFSIARALQGPQSVAQGDPPPAWVFRTSGWLLHLLVLLCAALVGLRLTSGAGRLYLPFLLAVIAVHPIQSDVVAWISARSSTLALLPGFALAWLALRRPHSARRACLCAGAAALLGMLAKEDGYLSGLIVLAVLAARPKSEDAFEPATAQGDLEAGGLQAVQAEPLGTLKSTWGASTPRGQRGPRPALLAGFLGAGLGLVLALGMRWFALGEWLPSAPHAPLAGESLGQRLIVGLAALGHGAYGIFIPTFTVPLHRAEHLPVDSAAILTAAFLIALVSSLAWRHRGTAAGWLFALVLAAWLPFTQWIPAGEVLAPRFFFAPLLCFTLGLAAAERRSHVATRTLALLLLVVTCYIPFARTTAANYTDRASFARSVIAHYPRDARAWNDLGVAHLEAGERLPARRALERALRLDPTYGRPHSNLGGLALEDGELERAEDHFEAATRLGPGNPVAFANLGAFRLRMDDPAAAREAYGRAVELAPGFATAWRGLGRALIALDENLAGKNAIKRANALDPTDARTLELLEGLNESPDP